MGKDRWRGVGMTLHRTSLVGVYPYGGGMRANILMGLAVSPKRCMVMNFNDDVTFAVYYNRPIARM